MHPNPLCQLSPNTRRPCHTALPPEPALTTIPDHSTWVAPLTTTAPPDANKANSINTSSPCKLLCPVTLFLCLGNIPCGGERCGHSIPYMRQSTQGAPPQPHMLPNPSPAVLPSIPCSRCDNAHLPTPSAGCRQPRCCRCYKRSSKPRPKTCQSLQGSRTSSLCGWGGGPPCSAPCQQTLLLLPGSPHRMSCYSRHTFSRPQADPDLFLDPYSNLNSCLQMQQHG